MVNLVSETRVVPEFIGKNCIPADIAKALQGVLDDPTAQRAAMRTTMERLGAGGEDPGLRAAKAILSVLAVHSMTLNHMPHWISTRAKLIGK